MRFKGMLISKDDIQNSTLKNIIDRLFIFQIHLGWEVSLVEEKYTNIDDKGCDLYEEDFSNQNK